MEYYMGSNPEFLDDETTCRVCYAEFLDANDLSQHIVQVHLNEGNRNRYCCVCRSFFQDVDEYALHIRTYHLKYLRWCKHCTRVFFNKEDLRVHEKKHGDWKYKLCSHCDKTFKFADILATHEYENHRTHTDASEGIMLQDIFPALSALIHMDVKKFLTVPYTHESYKCISCGHATSDIDKFLQHVETEGKKVFVCNKCSQVFDIKRNLSRHLQRKCKRSVEWAECDMCEKKIDRTVFEAHTKKCATHKCNILGDNDTDNTPKSIPILNCKFCKKMFVGNVALDKHIDRTHKQNFHLYKYKCTTCDIPFQHPKYLFAHYFTHHKEMQPYTCKICNKTYRVRKSFTLHIKLDHKSVGFVEFNEDYKVFFTDKKSEKPFQPSSVALEYIDDKQITGQKTETTKINLTFENSDFINGTETECETDVDKKKSLSITLENVELETECETDADGRNVLKSAGAPEYDTECETDVDRKTENLKASYIEVEVDYANNDADKPIMKQQRPKKDDSETDVDMTIKKGKRESKSRVLKTRYNKQDYVTEVSSNDSDVPLIEMTKRNMEELGRRRRKNKFVCLKCNKNCYTYQNYNHHLSLHVGRTIKKCIKCKKSFKSKLALDEHMKKKHTTSKLTETLKQVLERRRNGAQVSTDPSTLRVNLQKTIQKVNIPEDGSTPAVLKLIEDGLSAKSFIESFVPEDSAKEIKITSSITIKEIRERGSYKSPQIKMTKFKPEAPIKSLKLRMPVKFKPENISYVKAKLKIIQKPILTLQKPQFSLNTAPDKHYDDHSYNSDNVFIDDREEIPEVAEEVMLNTEEKDETKELKILDGQGGIVIPNIPEQYGDIKIAHLQPEAPFYKIISMKDIVKTASQKPQEAEQSPEEGPVTLPGGMKLVTVNPLAHLIGDKNVEKLLKPNKYYAPKAMDIKLAMEKAMRNVYQPKRRQKIN